jgi:hypothetical protein
LRFGHLMENEPKLLRSRSCEKLQRLVRAWIDASTIDRCDRRDAIATRGFLF